ncbi:MAG TPA: hypothetical protein VIX91_16115 [Candidatus Acidoferrum sp.]
MAAGNSTNIPENEGADDRLTLIAIAVLACILGDVLHEGLGHGVTALLGGAHRLTISTVALQSDIGTRWISANGTLVNLFFGGVFWLLLRRAQNYAAATRYFLVIALAGNLFSSTGYFFYSGISNFGDWAAVIQGWQPHWAWRVGLFVLGVATYWASMIVAAKEMKRFSGIAGGRTRRLCWTPYFTDGVLAGLAGLFNPLGWIYVLLSALPSTRGANTGLLFLPGMMRGIRGGETAGAGVVKRSPAWIVAGAIAGVLFIVVLGRGLTWTR